MAEEHLQHQSSKGPDIPSLPLQRLSVVKLRRLEVSLREESVLLGRVRMVGSGGG